MNNIDIDNLQIKEGIFWSCLWFFILFFNTKHTIYSSLIQSLYFFIGWVIISVILFYIM